MKGRLHEASLVEPGLAIVGEEPIAEDLLGRLHHGKVFTVGAVILLEDALHLIGVIEHVGRPEEEAEVDHVTIALPDRVALRKLSPAAKKLMRLPTTVCK